MRYKNTNSTITTSAVVAKQPLFLCLFAPIFTLHLPNTVDMQYKVFYRFSDRFFVGLVCFYFCNIKSARI